MLPQHMVVRTKKDHQQGRLIAEALVFWTASISTGFWSVDAWMQDLLGGPWLGAEIVILSPPDSPLPLGCQVVSDSPVQKSSQEGSRKTNNKNKGKLK